MEFIIYLYIFTPSKSLKHKFVCIFLFNVDIFIPLWYLIVDLNLEF